MTSAYIPVAAMQVLTKRYGARSDTGVIARFLTEFKYPLSAPRIKAGQENTTITEAVRRLMTHHIPELEPLWPARKASQAQIAYAQRAKKVVGVEPALVSAARIIERLMANPESAQAKRRAREWLAHYRTHHA